MSIFFGQNNPLFLFVLDEALVICRENIHIHMIIIVMTKAVSNRDICFIIVLIFWCEHRYISQIFVRG